MNSGLKYGKPIIFLTVINPFVPEGLGINANLKGKKE
jgi:hypothetical protein